MTTQPVPLMPEIVTYAHGPLSPGPISPMISVPMAPMLRRATTPMGPMSPMGLMLPPTNFRCINYAPPRFLTHAQMDSSPVALTPHPDTKRQRVRTVTRGSMQMDLTPAGNSDAFAGSPFAMPPAADPTFPQSMPLRRASTHGSTIYVAPGSNCGHRESILASHPPPPALILRRSVTAGHRAECVTPVAVQPAAMSLSSPQGCARATQGELNVMQARRW